MKRYLVLAASVGLMMGIAISPALGLRSTREALTPAVAGYGWWAQPISFPADGGVIPTGWKITLTACVKDSNPSEPSDCQTTAFQLPANRVTAFNNVDNYMRAAVATLRDLTAYP